MTEAEHGRLRAFLNGGDLSGALRYLTALDLDRPGRPSVFYHLGYVHGRMSDFAEAARSYTKAIEIDPTVPTFHLGLGVAFQQQGDFERAIDALNHAIELDPSYANAWNSLGFTYRMRGDASSALKAYRRAQEVIVAAASNRVKAEWPAATQVRVNEAGEKGLLVTPEYFSALKSRLRSDLLYATVMNNIGGCYLDLGQPSEAKGAFVEAIEFIPEGAEYESPYIGLRRLDTAT